VTIQLVLPAIHLSNFPEFTRETSRETAIHAITLRHTRRRIRRRAGESNVGKPRVHKVQVYGGICFYRLPLDWAARHGHNIAMIEVCMRLRSQGSVICRTTGAGGGSRTVTDLLSHPDFLPSTVSHISFVESPDPACGLELPFASRESCSRLSGVQISNLLLTDFVTNMRSVVRIS